MNNKFSIADDDSDPLSDYDPTEYDSEFRRLIAEECVEAIPSRPFREVSPDTTIASAIALLSELEVASLLVVDDGKLVGIFTERDVLEKVSECYSRVCDRPISEAMTANPIVVYECDAIAAALAAIAIGGYRHVPVLSMSDEVLGVVSPRRVFDYLQNRLTATV